MQNWIVVPPLYRCACGDPQLAGFELQIQEPHTDRVRIQRLRSTHATATSVAGAGKDPPPSLRATQWYCEDKTVPLVPRAKDLLSRAALKCGGTRVGCVEGECVGRARDGDCHTCTPRTTHTVGKGARDIALQREVPRET